MIFTKILPVVALLLALSASPAICQYAAAPTPAPASGPTSSRDTGPVVTLLSVDLSDNPFSSVCWPFNTYIQPGDNYSLIVQSEDVVQQALTWDLNNDTLELSTTADFASGYPIEVVVSLPFDALSGVFVPSPAAEVTVGPGFVTDSFTASAPFSSRDLNILTLTADTLRIQSTGLGQIYVDGLIGNASIVASGAGSIYVVGLEDTAVVNLAGSASATIKATNNAATIVGQSTGINTVLYQLGTCAVTTPFLFGSPCQQTYTLDLPTIDPLWTCGVRVTGNFTCPTGGAPTSQITAASGVLPIARAAVPPVSPPPSPSAIPRAALVPPVQPSPAAAIQVPPPATIISLIPTPASPPLLLPPPASPPINFVSSVGTGPQFAGASGQGNQVAQAVSAPGLQQQNTGASTPASASDLLNTPGFSSNPFGDLSNSNIFSGNGRRLQQSLFSGGASASAYSTGKQSTQTSFGSTSFNSVASKTVRSFPCYTGLIGGYDALQILGN